MTHPATAPQPAAVYPFEVIDSETDETIDVFESLADAGRVANDEAARLGRDIEIYHCAAKLSHAMRWRVSPSGAVHVIGRAS